MITLSLRTVVRNAAAVFSGCYGAVTRQAEQAGCSRQTVYDHARRVEQRLQSTTPAPPADAPAPPADAYPLQGALVSIPRPCYSWDSVSPGGKHVDMDEILQRFLDQAPVAVMVRAT